MNILWATGRRCLGKMMPGGRLLSESDSERYLLVGFGDFFGVSRNAAFFIVGLDTRPDRVGAGASTVGAGGLGGDATIRCLWVEGPASALDWRCATRFLFLVEVGVASMTPIDTLAG